MPAPFGLPGRQLERHARHADELQARVLACLREARGIPVGRERRVVFIDLEQHDGVRVRGAAQQTAETRGNAIADKFLTKLETENPDSLKQAEAPDFQDAFFTVQKEYAKSGDEDLGNLLVNLLVDRSKQKVRDIKQIVHAAELIPANHGRHRHRAREHQTHTRPRVRPTGNMGELTSATRQNEQGA